MYRRSKRHLYEDDACILWRGCEAVSVSEMRCVLCCIESKDQSDPDQEYATSTFVMTKEREAKPTRPVCVCVHLIVPRLIHLTSPYYTLLVQDATDRQGRQAAAATRKGANNPGEKKKPSG